jgi:hypothetical protein
VNQRDRVVLTKVYRALNEMTVLSPLNPMDVRAVSANLRTCTGASRDLMFALFHLGAEEHSEADECAEEALRRLKEARKARD